MEERSIHMTQEEIFRDEIVRDLDSNIFVEAGAGAGKTSILVRRILNQLKTGTAKVEELVVITFTNKASQELKSRISDAVRKALHNAVPETAGHQNLKNALYNMDRMQISTIHSFCYRLLMEQTFLAAMRMDMEMIEDDDAKTEQEAFFQSWYKTLDYETVMHVRSNFAGKRVVPVLKQVFSDICELPEDTEVFYDRDLLKRSLKWFMDEASRQKARLARLIVDELNLEAGTHYTTIEEIADTDGAFLAKFRKLVQGNADDIAFLKDAAGLDIFNSRNPWKIKKAACGEMTGHCWEQFKQSFDLDAYDRDFRAYQNALVIAFIMPAREEYKKLHQNRYITNNTLLEKARDLVVNHPDARSFFQRKYKCIYVDEFQDTDHVQTDLIFALCSDGNGGLKAGSLFVVGDPKQSIYRFRGADLPLYFSVKEKMAGMPGCRLFNLNYNFRSSEEVVSFVNENNARILQDYRPMESRSQEPVDERPAKQISGVYINWDPAIPIQDQGPRDDVSDVVKIIRGLVDNHISIWDKDKNNGKGEKKGGYRPVCYKDFLVLCFSTYHMENYLAAMLADGIPVQISGKVIMSNVREMNRFSNLYRYLAYPQYARAKEGALQTVLAMNVNSGNYQTGMGRLGRLRNAVKGMDGISMALYLLRHPEYVLDWDRGMDKYYLLRIQAQLQQMIETVSGNCVNNAQALSDGFMEYVSGEVDRELSLSAESDAVRFMNLHKAKGLEGRIVIICKRSESFVPKEGSFQVRKDDTGYLLYHTVEEKVSEFSSNKYPAYVHDDEIRRKAETEELAEYRRLEYVEATRGMEALIFTMPVLPKNAKKDDKEYSFRSYDFSGCKQMEREFPEIYGEMVNPTADDVTEYDFHRWDPDFIDEQFRADYYTLTPSSLEMGIPAAGVDADTAEPAFDEAGVEENASPSAAVQDTAKRPTGNIFGVVMHRALELLVIAVRNGEAINDQRISACTLQAIMESGDEMEDVYGPSVDRKASEYLEFLRNVLGKFVAAESVVTEIKEAATVHTEFPFSFYTTEDESPEMFEALRAKVSGKKAASLFHDDPKQQIWINGRADLILIGRNGTIHIYDYKSDLNPGLPSEAFAEIIDKRYSGQMELYRYVCAKLFQVPVDQVIGEFYLID